MSDSSLKISGAAAPKDDSYGPDRTLIQVADWLTGNATVISAVFGSMSLLSSFTVKQREFEEGSEIISSNALYSYNFLDGSTLDDDEVVQILPLRHLKLMIGARGEGIAQHCVLDRRPFFLEVFALSLRLNGACRCTIRHTAFSPDETSIHEMVEQYFRWKKVNDRYSGVSIELRLWSPYIPAFLKGPKERLNALRDNPISIQRHDETVRFCDEGFRSLFLMQRPPNRISFGQCHISAHYLGENQHFRKLTNRTAN